MARTNEERELWFEEFAKTLGFGTNPKNAANSLIDHIYILKDDEPIPSKAFVRNPFTFSSSPKQREEAIDLLMDAYEKGELLAPDDKGEIRLIGPEDGKDFMTIDPEEPKLEGSPLSRSIKKAINNVLPFAFKKDMEEEKQYEKELAKYKELKELAEKNKVSMLAMSQAKKQQEEEESSEKQKEELDKQLKDFENDLHNMMVLENNPILMKKDDPLKMFAPKDGTNPDEMDPDLLDMSDLTKVELESLQEYTLTYIAAKSSPEELKDFLEHPGKRTVGMQMMVEEARAEFAMRRSDFKDNPENEGKDFLMEDPELTGDAVENLSSVMQKEDKLSPMHRTAAKLSQKLVPAYKKQAAKNGKNNDREFDLKFLESMNKMAEIYAEGMAAKKALMGMDALRQNSQERLDALAKVGAMESVNAVLQDSVKNVSVGNVNPDTGLSKEQEFITSDVFSKDFMQQKAARSKTIQSLANEKPEDFRKKFMSLDDKAKLAKFGRTVNSEGSASLLKSMIKQQEQKEKVRTMELTSKANTINNQAKIQTKKQVKSQVKSQDRSQANSEVKNPEKPQIRRESGGLSL